MLVCSEFYQCASASRCVCVCLVLCVCSSYVGICECVISLIDSRAKAVCYLRTFYTRVTSLCVCVSRRFSVHSMRAFKSRVLCVCYACCVYEFVAGRACSIAHTNHTHRKLTTSSGAVYSRVEGKDTLI